MNGIPFMVEIEASGTGHTRVSNRLSLSNPEQKREPRTRTSRLAPLSSCRASTLTVSSCPPSSPPGFLLHHRAFRYDQVLSFAAIVTHFGQIVPELCIAVRTAIGMSSTVQRLGARVLVVFLS
eukprot:1289828-Rhodomonas_salina.3